MTQIWEKKKASQRIYFCGMGDSDNENWLNDVFDADTDLIIFSDSGKKVTKGQKRNAASSFVEIGDEDHVTPLKGNVCNN